VKDGRIPGSNRGYRQDRLRGEMFKRGLRASGGGSPPGF